MPLKKELLKYRLILPIKSLILFLIIVLPNSSVGKNKKHEINIFINGAANLNFISLAGGNSITLQPTAPTEAGNSLDFSNAVNSDIWINYSSVVQPGKSHDIAVQITSGQLPDGLDLKVVASPKTGDGNGKLGKPTGEINISGEGQTVLTDIKSCYTGAGIGNGHNLTYSLDISSPTDYYKLATGTNTITVTYTFTEEE